MNTYFTKEGAPVWASLADGIQFPDLSEFVAVDISVARSGELKPVNYMKLVEQFRAGEKVNLAKGGQLRFGCAFALKVFLNDDAEGQYVFSKFSDTHPTQPNKITPPGGIYDRIDISPQQLACDELSEEIIFAFATHRLIRSPSFNNVVHTKHIDVFCEQNKYGWSPEFIFPVNIVQPKQTVRVRFGEKYDYQVGVTFEPVGSVELIWFGEARLRDHGYLHGVKYFDGELFPDGTARNSSVVSEKYEDYPQSEKAQLVLEIG